MLQDILPNICPKLSELIPLMMCSKVSESRGAELSIISLIFGELKVFSSYIRPWSNNLTLAL